jgi:hypothetical protein
MGETKSVESSTALARDLSLLRVDTRNGNKQGVYRLPGQEIVQPDHHSTLSEPG